MLQDYRRVCGISPSLALSVGATIIIVEQGYNPHIMEELQAMVHNTEETITQSLQAGSDTDGIYEHF
jgi:hypothetical protein